MDRGGKRKKDKRFYVQNAKKARMAQYHLVPDLKGFLISCNQREREAIREAYKVLNQFDDDQTEKKPQKDEKGPEASKNDNEEEEEEDEEDIDAALKKEKTQLEEEQNKKTTEKRFQVVESGIQNVLFIRTKLDDPGQLVQKILDNILESGQQISRYMLRLLPIEITCKAYEESLEASAKPVLEKFFKDQGEITYCINFKARLNNNLKKESVYELVNKLVKEINSEAKVKYSEPKLTIFVELMKGLCCFSVLPDYMKYRKYNLIELAKVNGEDKTDDSESKEKVKCDESKSEEDIENPEKIEDSSQSNGKDIVEENK